MSWRRCSQVAIFRAWGCWSLFKSLDFFEFTRNSPFRRQGRPIGDPGTIKRIDRKGIKRVAPIYASNQAARAALGITPSSFARLCRRYNIQTPYTRRQVRFTREAT